MSNSLTDGVNEAPANPLTQHVAEVKKRGLDEELQVMSKIDKLLSELPTPALERVFNWLRSRYSMEPSYIPVRVTGHESV